MSFSKETSLLQVVLDPLCDSALDMSRDRGKKKTLLTLHTTWRDLVVHGLATRFSVRDTQERVWVQAFELHAATDAQPRLGESTSVGFRDLRCARLGPKHEPLSAKLAARTRIPDLGD
jgi:hypothetical protein